MDATGVGEVRRIADGAPLQAEGIVGMRLEEQHAIETEPFANGAQPLGHDVGDGRQTSRRKDAAMGLGQSLGCRATCDRLRLTGTASHFLVRENADEILWNRAIESEESRGVGEFESDRLRRRDGIGVRFARLVTVGKALCARPEARALGDPIGVAYDRKELLGHVVQRPIVQLDLVDARTRARLR